MRGLSPKMAKALGRLNDSPKGLEIGSGEGCIESKTAEGLIRRKLAVDFHPESGRRILKPTAWGQKFKG